MNNVIPDILNYKSNSSSIDKQEKITDCYEMENEKIFVYRCNICLLVFTCVYSFANHISNENHRVKQLDALKKDKYFNCLRCKYICLSVVKIIKHIELYNHGHNILKKIKKKIPYTGTVNCACKIKCYFFYSQNKNFRNVENIQSTNNNLLNVKSEMKKKNSFEEKSFQNKAYQDKNEEDISLEENNDYMKNYNNQNQFIQNKFFEQLKELMKEISTNDNIKIQFLNYLQKNSLYSYDHNNCFNNNINSNNNSDSNAHIEEQQPLNLIYNLDNIKDLNTILSNLDKYEEEEEEEEEKEKEINNTRNDIKKNLLLYINENTYNLNKIKNCHSNSNNMQGDKKNSYLQNEDELSIYDNNLHRLNSYFEENYTQFKNGEYNQFMSDEYNHNYFKNERKNSLCNEEELKKNRKKKNQTYLNLLNNSLNELKNYYVSNNLNNSKENYNKGYLNYESFFKNNDKSFDIISNDDFINPIQKNDEKNKDNIFFNNKKNSSKSIILENIYKDKQLVNNYIINNNDENIIKYKQENIYENVHQNINENINKDIIDNVSEKINENECKNLNENINKYSNNTKSTNDIEDKIDFIYNSNFHNNIVRKYFYENLKSDSNVNQINECVVDNESLSINNDNFLTKYNYSLKETEKKDDNILENFYEKMSVFDNLKHHENIHNIREMDLFHNTQNIYSYFNDAQLNTGNINKNENNINKNENNINKNENNINKNENNINKNENNINKNENNINKNENNINKNENNINNAYNAYNHKRNSNYLTSNLIESKKEIKENCEKKNYIDEYEEEMKTKLLNHYNDNKTNNKKFPQINIFNKLENSNLLKSNLELFDNTNKIYSKIDNTNYNFMSLNKYNNLNNDNIYNNIQLINLQQENKKKREEYECKSIDKKDKKNLNILKNEIFKINNFNKVDPYISLNQNYDPILNKNDNLYKNMDHIDEKNNKNTLNEISDIKQKRKSFIQEIDELKKIIEEDNKNNSNTFNHTAINLNSDQKFLNSNHLFNEKNNLMNSGNIKKYHTEPNNISSDNYNSYNIKIMRKSNTDYFQKYAFNSSNEKYMDSSNEEFNNFISNFKKVNN
ncbi:conserved Plasmodium protein, unknown function [Plasmodium gallinaceum]|uniref:C2H2-type domain-containing protein n=1 Tax=Plasmodium gallinaceum TaxID=5849 RepID=A0A1J1H0Q6_PLAGA|nr:conserved Plasmodium protein, unknown function [Plasmodium gallinaceum]CRG98147.1 conserved Plasmodium protein, unknown function [Plasmodium gallinaceum]